VITVPLDDLPERIDAWKVRHQTGGRVYRSELASAAADARQLVAENHVLKASLKASQPLTYERGNGHSYLADQARVALNRGDGDGGVKAAKQRLAAHRCEVDAELPGLLERRDVAARAATEAALTQSVAEVRALERFTAAGGRLFGEQRALSRTDGQAGYFIGPLWAIESFIPYALAGRVFANLWTNLPLPALTDEINLPKVTLGPATGTQAGDLAAPATRDLTDSFANGQVRTIAGIIDLPLQMLDQSPVDVDATYLPMLLADYNAQVDGLALLGSSSYGQPNGVAPGGALGAATMVNLQLTNNGSSQSWAYGGASIAGSPHYAAAQLLSKIATFRAQRPTAWVVNDIVWSQICAAADQQQRPIVCPGVHSSAAGPNLHGLPVVIDPAVPVTFTNTTGGSAVNPSMGPLTSGQVAPVAGTGTYTPVLCGRWADCFLYEGDYRLQVFREAESGNLNARIRLHNYVAMIANRFTWAGSNQTFSGTNQSGGLNAAGAVSYGALTQMVTNSVLQSGTGF
jgi:HK97 family phage major capsid protein